MKRRPEHCPLCTTAAACARHDHPGLIAEMSESYAVLADNQGCPGWCVLVLKAHVEHLAELPLERQLGLWRDATRVAAAQRLVFAGKGEGGGPVRINYACLGNVEPHVHVHLVPRHGDDPDPTGIPMSWPADRQRGQLSDSQRADLVVRLRRAMGA